MNWKVPAALKVAQSRTNSYKIREFVGHGVWMPANGAECVSVVAWTSTRITDTPSRQDCTCQKARGSCPRCAFTPVSFVSLPSVWCCPRAVSVLPHGLSIRVAAQDHGMLFPHAAQLGPRQTADAAKDDCQCAAQGTKARHRRESRGADPCRVASNLQLTEDHARASETWSRRSSQHGLANHAGVRSTCETCTKVPSNEYAECARAFAVARSSGGNCACPRSLVNRAQPK